MLVLSRKKNESIVIGEGIVITIVEVGGSRVRLGIDAPADVSVNREEVQRLVQRQTTGQPGRASGNAGGTCGREMLLA